MAVSSMLLGDKEYYSITDSTLISTLGNYIGYGEATLREQAKEELTKDYLYEQYIVFKKDIKRVLYDNFKVKKKIVKYNDIELVNMIINGSSQNEDEFEKASMIAIIKVLDNVEKEIKMYIEEDLDYDSFGGEASFLYSLLFHILEFTERVATDKEGKNYCHICSRKKVLAQEVIDMARRMPRSQMYYNEITHIHESVFFIRQAIELKTLEALKLIIVYNKKYNRPVKITPDILLDILDSQCVKSVDIDGNSKNVDVAFLKNVHFWTNAFIHTGGGYWAWEVELVRSTILEYILNRVEIEKGYLIEIPNMIRERIKEDEREDAEIIMTKEFYREIAECK